MENENEKKSWWKSFKSFIKKILPGKKAAVTLGIAATAMGANMDKANASDYIVERTDGKAITDVAHELNVNPVDLKNLTVDANQLEQRIDARSDLEKASDTLKNVNTGVRSVENVWSSVNNLGKSSSIKSTVNNAQRVVDNVNKGQDTLSQLLSKPSVKETKTEEVKTEKTEVENQKADTTITQDTSSAKEVKQADKAKVISDTDKVLANSHFDSIKQNPYDMEDALSSEIVDLNLKLSKARYDGNFELAKQLEKQLEAKRAQRIELTELRRSEGITADVLEHSPEYQDREYTPERVERLTAFTKLSPNWTSGEKLAVLSSGIVDLKVAIDGCIKNGDVQTANKLIRVHNEALKQRYELAKMAHEEQGNSEFDVHMPKNYDRYGLKNRSSQETVSKTEKEEKTKYSPSKVEGIDVEDIFGDIDLAAAVANAQVAQATQQDLDASKLSDVSVGQMGILEEDEMPKEAPKKEELDYEKLSNVSAGQMGIWNELEEMLDNEINKTSSATSTDNKKEVTVEEKAEKQEVKQAVSKDTKTVDNYKSNEEKINIDDLFKHINLNEFIEKGKDTKSHDDGEER